VEHDDRVIAAIRFSSDFITPPVIGVHDLPRQRQIAAFVIFERPPRTSARRIIVPACASCLRLGATLKAALTGVYGFTGMCLYFHIGVIEMDQLDDRDAC
jgi:hypothetical protein